MSSRSSSPVGSRAPFQEPLPLWRAPLPAPRPALAIRLPPLKLWTCDGCHALYPSDVYQCDDCLGSDEDEEEDEEEAKSDEEEENPWYCHVCDDFCSNGGGLCRRCARELAGVRC